ncbi:MAG TPA: phosphoribosyltransferase [Candidatus Paceibacterota bacterium]
MAYRNDPGYYDDALSNPIPTVDKCIRALAESRIDYDTIVVQGISGMLIGPMLAAFTGKNLLIVPKPDDTHNHRGHGPVGTIEGRWIFVDDFISTGATHNRVREEVSRYSPESQEVAIVEYFANVSVKRLYAPTS